jgi:N-acyl-D-aspartate/D-glutamate deacylase
MPEEQRCDILLRGGTVFDGLGNPGFCADVAITGERVVAIGELEGWRAGVELSVEGLCVAPGFIDIHTHADFSLNHHPEQLSVLFQGVTTQVGGNCGFAVGQIDDTPLFRQEQRWLKPYGVSHQLALVRRVPAHAGRAGAGHELCAAVWARHGA